VFATKEMGMGRLPVALRVALGAGACGLAGAIFAPGMLLGAPATAQVTEGDFTPPKLLTEFNTFFPGRTVIHQGDKVRFTIQGFHTLVIPKKGGDPPALLVPTGQVNPAKNDPAGVPYWWAGQPALNFNPAAAGPSGGTVATGAKTISSGFLNGNAPKFTVTFPKAGTFQVRCAVHPKMRGTIVVRPRTKSVPTAATLARRATAQLAALNVAAVKNLKKARANTSPATTVQIGPGVGSLETLAFFPNKNAVPAGTTVKFQMAGLNEFHTVTFGPKAYVDPVERAFQNNADPEGVYASDPPGTPVSETPTTHGNGFLNSGILLARGYPRGPHSFSVTFPTPGVYAYRCMVHPEMTGSITVS
jgi:plastocyanin